MRVKAVLCVLRGMERQELWSESYLLVPGAGRLHRKQNCGLEKDVQGIECSLQVLVFL